MNVTLGYSALWTDGWAAACACSLSCNGKGGISSTHVHTHINTHGHSSAVSTTTLNITSRHCEQQLVSDMLHTLNRISTGGFAINQQDDEKIYSTEAIGQEKKAKQKTNAGKKEIEKWTFCLIGSCKTNCIRLLLAILGSFLIIGTHYWLTCNISGCKILPTFLCIYYYFSCC